MTPASRAAGLAVPPGTPRRHRRPFPAGRQPALDRLAARASRNRAPWQPEVSREPDLRARWPVVPAVSNAPKSPPAPRPPAHKRPQDAYVPVGGGGKGALGRNAPPAGGAG